MEQGAMFIAFLCYVIPSKSYLDIVFAYFRMITEENFLRGIYNVKWVSY